MRTKPEEPYSRMGHCCGCGKDGQLFLLAPSRYRCEECRARGFDLPPPPAGWQPFIIVKVFHVQDEGIKCESMSGAPTAEQAARIAQSLQDGDSHRTVVYVVVPTK